jgi:uncharacterized membrane protein
MSLEFDVDVEIARRTSEVFDYVTDISKLSEWQPLVKSVEAKPSPPLAKGTVLRETRLLRGRELTQLVEVAEFERPRRFSLRVLEGALPVDGELTFEPVDGGGTHLHVHASGRPTGPFRFLAPLLRTFLRRQFQGQYDELKRVLEN